MSEIVAEQSNQQKVLNNLFNNEDKPDYYTKYAPDNIISDPFWLDNLSILYQKDRLNQIFPTPNMTLNEKSNSLVRVAVAIGIALFMLKNDTRYMYIPIFVLLFTLVMIKYNKEDAEKYFDSFSNSQKNIHNQEILNRPPNTLPTKNNPFMNINTITDPRDKGPAVSSWNNEVVKEKVEHNFENNLYRDVGDLYGKNNSQREFYTMPSTTIPNAQTEFAKWCYKTGPTCKERTIECVPYTNCLNDSAY